MVDDGGSATFECIVLAEPEHQISWSFTDSGGVTTANISATDVEASNFSKYSINRNRNDTLFGALTVNRVSHEDHGTYSCVADNDYGSKDVEANLTVHG